MKKSILSSIVLTLVGVFMLNAQNYVTIYRSCNYQGDSQRLYEGEYRDRDIQIGNDRISAIRIPKGWVVTVYKANDFKGANETYDSDVRCLPEQFNDAISSIRVYRASSGNANAVTIFRSCNYNGDSQVLREGRYLDRDIKIGNDRISAIRVPDGWAVTVYKANNFQGASETYYDDVRCLPEQFNDAISSLRVFRSSGRYDRSSRNDNRYNNRRSYGRSFNIQSLKGRQIADNRETLRREGFNMTDTNDASRDTYYEWWYNPRTRQCYMLRYYNATLREVTSVKSCQ